MIKTLMLSTLANVLICFGWAFILSPQNRVYEFTKTIGYSDLILYIFFSLITSLVSYSILIFIRKKRFIYSLVISFFFIGIVFYLLSFIFLST